MLKAIALATVISFGMASGAAVSAEPAPKKTERNDRKDNRADRIRTECAKTMNPAACHDEHR